MRHLSVAEGRFRPRGEGSAIATSTKAQISYCCTAVPLDLAACEPAIRRTTFLLLLLFEIRVLDMGLSTLGVLLPVALVVPGEKPPLPAMRLTLLLLFTMPPPPGPSISSSVSFALLLSKSTGPSSSFSFELLLTTFCSCRVKWECIQTEPFCVPRYLPRFRLRQLMCVAPSF